jgi:outer membrane protein assembly factor BamB
MVVSGDMVIAATEVTTGSVYGFACDTCQVSWRPALAGDRYLYVDDKGTLRGLRAADGGPAWERRFNEPVMTSVSIFRGVAYVGTRDRVYHAVVPATGELKSHLAVPGVNWTPLTCSDRGTVWGTFRPPIVGRLAIAGTNHGHVLAYNLASGDLAWEVQIEDRAPRSIVEDPDKPGRIYIGSGRGTLYAFDGARKSGSGRRRPTTR